MSALGDKLHELADEWDAIDPHPHSKMGGLSIGGTIRDLAAEADGAVRSEVFSEAGVRTYLAAYGDHGSYCYDCDEED